MKSIGPKLAKQLRLSQEQSASEARAVKAALKAKRDELRHIAKTKRLWAVRHVQSLPIWAQKKINASYKRARLTGETNLSYARWCAEMYREADDPSQYPGAIQDAIKWDAGATSAMTP